MSEINIAQAIQERQAKFIENRTIIEAQVNAFLQSLKECTPDVIALLPSVFTAPDVTARTLLPALWAEPFDPNAYSSQLSIFLSHEAVVKDLYNKMNLEALQCLRS